MQIKTTLRFHLTPVRIATIKKTTTNMCGKDVGKKEPSYTAGGNASWCNHSGKKIWRLLKNLNIDLPYDPAIPLLGYTQRNATQVTPEAPAYLCLLQHYSQ
jgi:hypothetical protein